MALCLKCAVPLKRQQGAGVKMMSVMCSQLVFTTENHNFGVKEGLERDAVDAAPASRSSSRFPSP